MADDGEKADITVDFNSREGEEFKPKHYNPYRKHHSDGRFTVKAIFEGGFPKLERHPDWLKVLPHHQHHEGKNSVVVYHFEVEMSLGVKVEPGILCFRASAVKSLDKTACGTIDVSDGSGH